MKMLEKLFKKV